MSATDDVRQVQREEEGAITAEVPASREVIEAVEADPEAFERLLSDQFAGELLATDEAIAEYRRTVDGTLRRFYETLMEEAKRDRHRRLFGHQRARVFILGDRLVVAHPRGGAA